MSIAFTGLTPLQLNVLQVSIDSMEEHLLDVAFGGEVDNQSIDGLQWRASTILKLIATKEIQAALREVAS